MVIVKRYYSEVNYDLNIKAVVFLREFLFVYCFTAYLPGEKIQIGLQIVNVDLFPILRT